MKAAQFILSIFLVTGIIFSGCEKFELEDHCPEEEQNIDHNPQDLRVNDDTDNEEELGSEVNNKSLDGSGFNGSLNQSTPADHGNDSGSDGEDDTSGDNDDTVNDDSDNEDEHPRRPQDTATSGASSNR